jgi:hypothetical protein
VKLAAQRPCGVKLAAQQHGGVKFAAQRSYGQTFLMLQKYYFNNKTASNEDNSCYLKDI